MYCTLKSMLNTCYVNISLHLASVALDCENLHQLCPYSSAQRICTCTVTGSAVRWRTNLNGVFSTIAGVVLNTLSDMYTAMGFTVMLTNAATNNLTSIMTYTPSSVPPNRLVVVSCDDMGAAQTETAAITFKGMTIMTRCTLVSYTLTSAEILFNFI